jgi:phosphoenolpyruvate phosphomutase
MVHTAIKRSKFLHPRAGLLKAVLSEGKCLRIMEANNPLAALVVEASRVKNEKDSELQYDGLWSSSLSDSTSRGKPDIEVLDIRSRLQNIIEILESTSKPLIVDADTGGKAEHLVLNIASLENAGVSAIIIEDKTGLKKNSLLGTSVAQLQDSIVDFSEKLEKACKARANDDFMVIARIESLILNKGLDDALSRANSYSLAGADAIMIHSKQNKPAEILGFAARFRQVNPAIPLVCVPTTYNTITFSELAEAGFNVVIYANHLLRAAYPAMVKVAEGILKNGRSLEVESFLHPIDDILRLIPGTV